MNNISNLNQVTKGELPAKSQTFAQIVIGIDALIGVEFIATVAMIYLNGTSSVASGYVLAIGSLMAAFLIGSPLFTLWGVWRYGNKSRLGLYIAIKLFTLGALFLLMFIVMLSAGSAFNRPQLSEIPTSIWLFMSWQFAMSGLIFWVLKAGRIR